MFGPLPGIAFEELLILLVLLIVGIAAIVVLKALIHFILPIVAALVVWLVTRSPIDAGLTFVVVAILQLILRRK